MKSFYLAVQFLTIFPYPRGLSVEAGEAGRSMGHYATIGAILGGILYLADRLLGGHIATDLINLLLLAILTVLTGGLHWDGFCDTMDALGASRSREERLAIMRDSRVGAFGALSLIFLILLDLSALHLLRVHRGSYLFLAPLLSRFSMVLLALTQPYARKEKGMVRSFVEEVSLRELTLAGSIALIASLVLLKTEGLLLLCLVVAFTLLVGAYFRHRLGGITGDSLGAQNECMTALVWLFGCLH